jgi:hypothetical protein
MIQFEQPTEIRPKKITRKGKEKRKNWAESLAHERKGREGEWPQWTLPRLAGWASFGWVGGLTLDHVPKA